MISAKMFQLVCHHHSEQLTRKLNHSIFGYTSCYTPPPQQQKCGVHFGVRFALKIFIIFALSQFDRSCTSSAFSTFFFIYSFCAWLCAKCHSATLLLDAEDVIPDTYSDCSQKVTPPNHRRKKSEGRTFIYRIFGFLFFFQLDKIRFF